MKEIFHFLWFMVSCNFASCLSAVREERALHFPPSSTIGILAATAVPLDDRKNVFLSYNFEANYNSPYTAAQYIPGPLDRLDLVDRRSFNSETTVQPPLNEEDGDKVTTELPPKVRRSLVNRRNLYKTIENKLNAVGLDGHDCLLLTICQAELPLGLHNGVLGDIMHIVFTPSSSEEEDILFDFYDAEIHGTMGMCQHYRRRCPRSILDMISLFVH